ncbi:hypothetical protein H4R33_002378 [Dimargaris cristalligena]|uniref:SHSP domain-containing protein n=1 Tax=Dimargaris cristalligena TaxID=215637 RepID=A0A4V1J4K4_9FUNG|nr:hypothetical protein H4R33_002378 [Dimargaris cristalligena]RKP35869.1 hypothetical protein BJ085DRAFT_36320 [Dimargaris cristalligena]|eukprot:RKP35869.1 hypothetical protein BJ085DRAFT_36320 [Dimargaris cristalligena]
MPKPYSAFYTERSQVPTPANPSTQFPNFLSQGIPSHFQPWGIPGHNFGAFSGPGSVLNTPMEVLDTRETDSVYTISVLIPRVIPSSLRVTAMLGGLVLQGQTHDEHHHKHHFPNNLHHHSQPSSPPKHPHLSHFHKDHIHSFHHTLTVPSYVDTSRAEARTENGIITIKAPRRSLFSNFNE